MLPITSQPYRISAASRVRASRKLARGVRPLVLNAIVLGLSFALILWGALAAQEHILNLLERRFGLGPILTVVISTALTFAVPWLLVYLGWRSIWFRIANRRIAALTPVTCDLTATVDESGISIQEGDLSSSWLSWTIVTRLFVFDDTLVVARGTYGLVISLEAIGGRAALASLAARLSPAALAASDRSVRDGLA